MTAGDQRARREPNRHREAEIVAADKYATEAEKLDAMELIARLMSRDAPEYQIAVITGERGGQQGLHVIYDEVREGETLHSIWRGGCCLLRSRREED